MDQEELRWRADRIRGRVVALAGVERAGEDAHYLK
jgi:hypothetical protein